LFRVHLVHFPVKLLVLLMYASNVWKKYPSTNSGTHLKLKSQK
jgi:hypothetical protein